MVKAPLFNIEGEKIGEIDLPEDIFGVKVNKHLLWEYVKMYLANQRVGTASTKTRGEVRGSRRKIWPQKRTGRARHGDRYAPIFVGGGVAHGPKPRNWHYNMPKKQKRLALKCALSDRAKESRIWVFEDLKIPEIKTKRAVEFIRKIGLEGKKLLIVDDEFKEENLLSFRNIPKVEYRLAKDLNAYDVLWSEYIIMPKKSIEIFEERLRK